MERLRSLMPAVVAALLASASSGCLTKSLSDYSFPKLRSNPKPDAAVKPSPDTGIRQASAEMPAADPDAKEVEILRSVRSDGNGKSVLSKAGLKMEKSAPVSEIGVMWQNKLAQLPDPSRNGAMGIGLCGQLFVFGSNYQFVQAEGKLIVELTDETARPAGGTKARAVRWEFDRETLRGMVSHDERIGRCYALFLPWPSYKADITRVKLAVRFEPDSGHALYAPISTVTIDTSSSMDNPWSNGSLPLSSVPSPFGLPPGAGPTGGMPQPGMGVPGMPGALQAPSPLPPGINTGGPVATAPATASPANPAPGTGFGPIIISRNPGQN